MKQQRRKKEKKRKPRERHNQLKLLLDYELALNFTEDPGTDACLITRYIKAARRATQRVIEITQEAQRCNMYHPTHGKQKDDKTKRLRHHEDEEKEYMKHVEDPEDRESLSNKKTNPRINDPTKEPKENLEKRCQGCGQVPPGDAKGQHKKER